MSSEYAVRPMPVTRTRTCAGGRPTHVRRVSVAIGFVSLATGCDVRFTINAAGYSAAQQTACNPASAWAVAVQSPDRTPLANVTPAGVAVGAAVFEFRAAGDLLNPVAPLNVGAHSVTVNSATGEVSVQ